VWGADYPDPQNFLSQQLRTDVGNNNGHYSNAEFDALVDQADVLTGDVDARLACTIRLNRLQSVRWVGFRCSIPG
jgi:ABC-type oligopeptide transport system substrate-binding subunit